MTMPIDPKSLKAIEEFEQRIRRNGEAPAQGEGRVTAYVADEFDGDDTSARRPRSFADLDVSAIYAKFNRKAPPVNVFDDDDGED